MSTSFTLRGFRCLRSVLRGSGLLRHLLLLLGTYAVAHGESIPPGPGWHEIRATRLRAVCPQNGFGGSDYAFANYCPAVTAAWNSAVFDKLRNRLVVWGGGHNDYLGNELYALDLNSMTVRRLTDPGLPVVQSGCPESLVNGTQANSRHTYDSITYVEHADSMFVFGGSPGSPSGCFTRDTWSFSFITSTWERRTPRGPIPGGTPGIVAVYDHVSRKVFVHDRTTLYAYDFEANRYKDLASGSEIDYHMSGVIDPVRGKLVIVGAGHVHAYDIGPRSWYGRRTLKTTGGEFIVGSAYPGLAYDPVSDRIVAWNGGDTVYSLNLDSRVWSAVTFPGGPGKAAETGTFKRWSYSPASGVFILVNSMDSNAFAFRLNVAK